MGRLSWLARAALLALCAVGCGTERSDPPRGTPDVLLVVLDTVRADRLSTYGYARPTSPRLGALAELGVVFDDVTAPAPWTWPSHASIFTGLPPERHGARLAPGAEGTLRFGMRVLPLRSDVATLADRFRNHGYRTVALVVNDWLHPELGLLRGFETTRHFDRDAALLRAVPEIVDAPDPRPLLLFVNAMTAHAPYRDGPGPWALPDRAFLDPQRAPDWVRPYLTPDPPPGVNLSQVDHHGAPSGAIRHAAGELPIPPADLEKLRALYDAGVAGADFVLGRVLDAWIDAGRDGVVAVTSDHGEGFGEHGLLDHRASVYPEVLHVPLVIVAPGRLPTGQRIAAPVSLVALHDTLLELAGIARRGGSLVDVAHGADGPATVAASAGADAAWATHAGGRFAHGWRLFRRGDQALVHSPDTDRVELYDLARDPGMTRDLAAALPERTALLLTEARLHFATGIADADADADSDANEPLAIPDAVAQRLRDLGYAAPTPPAAPAP